MSVDDLEVDRCAICGGNLVLYEDGTIRCEICDWTEKP